MVDGSLRMFMPAAPARSRTGPSARGPIVATAALSLLVAALPLIPWLVTRSRSSEAWTGLVLIVVGVVVTAGLQPARSRDVPTLLLGVCGAVALVAGVAVEVRLVQAMGLATLVAALLPVIWPGRGASLPGLLLVLLGLPLAGDIDVVGFPLRRWSAELAALALPALGVPVAFAETVLVTEHGVADVEAPCAGLSTLRLLVASVAVMAALQRARVGATATATTAAVAVAVLGNASRVTILAWLVLGQGRPDLAALLHVPLGVCVFLAAAAAAAPLLGVGHMGAGAPSTALSKTLPSTLSTPTTWLLVGMAALAAGSASALRLQTRAAPPLALAEGDAMDQCTASTLAGLPGFSGDLAVPLSAAEEGLYRRHAIAAAKRRLPDGRGEVLIVVTRGLRSIHAPERCLAGNGHAVVSADVVLRGGVPVKRLVLDGGRVIGLSLLRSPQRFATGLTDVAAARLDGDHGPWIFVSAVVDKNALSTPEDEARFVADLVADTAAILRLEAFPSSAGADHVPSGVRP